MSAPFEIPEAAEARAIYSRRALARAVEHGVALLEALRLPRLVTGDFAPLHPAEVGKAIDEAIAALDALDAPTEDLEEAGDREPWLGWAYMHPAGAVDFGGTLDIEHDNADYEDDDPREETSLETAGRGFVRCGADDAEEDDPTEDSDPREPDDECGSEDAEDIGHYASRFLPCPLTQVERAEVAVIAERFATLRRAVHV